jgi:hypothetical protein
MFILQDRKSSKTGRKVKVGSISVLILIKRQELIRPRCQIDKVGIKRVLRFNDKPAPFCVLGTVWLFG